MIVPSSRLLLWTAVVVLPFAVLIAAEPAAAAIGFVFIGGLIVIAIADAAGAGRSLAGIGVELQPVNRMSKDREARLDLRVRNERRAGRLLRLALPLPREIQSPDEDQRVELPAGSEWSHFSWTCLPLKRGNYPLNTVCVEAASPLGFWAVRKTFPVRSEIRVYPNLMTDRKSLAALFLNRGAFGLHAQRQVGKGRDFEKLREYVPGDGFDEIHWKATARRGRPITKVFQIERTQEVYVIIDASRLAARTAEGRESRVESREPAGDVQPSTLDPRPSTTALERFVTAALVLGLAAEQQGDLFGLLTFTDKVEKFVRAKNGKAHYSVCRDALYTLQPKIVSPDFDELCTFIRLRMRRRALLVFLTSLDDPVLAESFVRNMELIRRQHVVLVNMLQPPGVQPLFTNPNIAGMDELYQHLGGHLLWHNLRELEKVLQRRGVNFSLLNNERLSAELVSQYLNVKRRQLL
ncbi:MAG TPA: DUF58 domain-containing protein [Verrucomicrobiota bacterium]|nr:DUF58 domain-containing protein [Verrucomicrobiota bacterium]